MAPPIVGEAEKLWETWNLRICILLSFFIQLCLTFLAPWRKCLKKMSSVIWIVYLLADAIALYTIGLISNFSKITSTNDIVVLWSPFLLVHLGGPDTITALALEDNELWLRHLLQLLTQSAGTLYLFYIVFGSKSGTNVLYPAIIMYVNGCVKYLERTASLYLASSDAYRESLIGKPDAGPNYAALMEEYASRKAANIPVEIRSNLETHSQNHIDDSLSGDCDDVAYEDQSTRNEEMMLVKHAHTFYWKFRGLIADIMLSFKERTESRKFFLEKLQSGEKAFKVIQIELNFMYDVFFTKVSVLQKARGITRVFSIVAVIASSLLFHLKNTNEYRKTDMYITCVLLGGAIFMDVIAVVMYFFSDWAVVAALGNAERQSKVPWSKLLEYWLRHRPRRWSEVISQYDLIYYCLNDQPTVLKSVNKLKSVKNVVESFLYVSESNFELNMGNLIFEELKIKATAAKSPEQAKKACEARGDLFSLDEFANYSNTLRPWTLEVDYDESLLLWHIATNLCIWSKNDKISKESILKFREYSKILGNYMMYLLIMKPSMTSSVAGIAQVRFHDTCDEARKFIRRKLPQEEIGMFEKVKQFCKSLTGLFKRLSMRLYNGITYFLSCCYCCGYLEKKEIIVSDFGDGSLHHICTRILAVNTDQKPVEVKGDKSKSVMFDACRLAKKLNEIGKKSGEEKQWELTFKVWVELLCYAASRSKPTAHVAQLREGGELITLVWLLMTQLGLGEQFRINKGTGWAKLIVKK